MDKKPGQVATRQVGLSESELRAKHDTMFKIRAAVKALPRGRYLPDQQMRDLAKVNTNVWRGYSESAEFEKYKIKLSGIVYWGVPDCIKRLKEDLSNV